MTMVALCQFKDGAIMLSDSRASYDARGRLVPNDSLQKILPIGKLRVFSYSGSVNIAERILQELRKLNHKKKEYQYLDGIVKKLPGLAEMIFVKSSQQEKDGGISIIFGGKTLSGKLEFWILQSPNFRLTPIEKDYEVMGSGSDVREYLEKDIERIKQMPDLKKRADAILIGVSSDLAKRNIDSVGGLFQIILISKDGIQPLNYGYVDLDPEDAGESAFMQLGKDGWIQQNLSTGEEIPVVHPTKLLRSPMSEKRAHDYKLPATPKESKWHLNYFISSRAIKIGPGTIEFHKPVTSFGSPTFPFDVEVMVGLGFWGSNGEENLELFFGKENSEEKIGEIPFNITFFPEDIDIQIKLNLSIKEPGLHSIEARIRGRTLGRRVMFFDKLNIADPKDDASKIAAQKIASEQLREGLAKCIDNSIVKSGKAELVYFSICEESVNTSDELVFKNQYWVSFWSKYPLPLRAHIASAFRLPVGKNIIRVDLVDAATRKATTITTATMETKTNCLIAPVHGDIIITVPKPGYYFINSYVNDVLIGKSVLIAETEKPQYSYTIDSSITDQVAKGQLFTLLRRSYQKKEE